jgi:hypothetical protein
MFIFISSCTRQGLPKESISEISLHWAGERKTTLHLSSNRDAGAELYSLILEKRSTLENLVER